MIATFQCTDGVRRDAFFHPSETVCGFGESMDFEDDDGVIRTGTRVPENGSTQVVCRDYQFRTKQLRRWDPRAKHHDKDGWAVCHGTKDARELTARLNGTGEKCTLA